ncbi:LysR family transcriptional regulator [Burkholderia cenocepacia]|nr:LysR family transcriptional regulator [Burkholderia cenocepacia]
MDLRTLSVFVEVVRQQTFTAAADKLFLTQSAVSKMMQTLEEDIGMPLFVRDDGQRKRRMVLTDAGRLVQTRAQDMLASEASLRADLAALGDLQRGELAIGIPPLGAKLIAPTLSGYHRRHPGIEIKMLESGSRVIEAGLRTAELELGYFLAPVADDLDFLTMYDYPLHLLAARDSAWAQHKSVRLAELANEPFLLYGETFMLNEVIARACQQAGFTPSIACRSNQWDLIATLVECGMGIALLPEPYCLDVDARRFVSIPVTEPAMRWVIVLAWRKAARLSRAGQAWQDLARAELATRDEAARKDTGKG